jgi:hypothetical protein
MPLPSGAKSAEPLELRVASFAREVTEKASQIPSGPKCDAAYKSEMGDSAARSEHSAKMAAEVDGFRMRVESDESGLGTNTGLAGSPCAATFLIDWVIVQVTKGTAHGVVAHTFELIPV